MSILTSGYGPAELKLLMRTHPQIGTAFGLTISTIVFNRVVDEQSAKLGVVVNAAGTNIPMAAELQGYKSAQWTNAFFPFFGMCVKRRVGRFR